MPATTAAAPDSETAAVPVTRTSRDSPTRSGNVIGIPRTRVQLCKRGEITSIYTTCIAFTQKESWVVRIVTLGVSGERLVVSTVEASISVSGWTIRIAVLRIQHSGRKPIFASRHALLKKTNLRIAILALCGGPGKLSGIRLVSADSRMQ